MKKKGISQVQEGTQTLKHSHAFTLQPPCLTVGIIIIWWNAELDVTELQSSKKNCVHRTLFQFRRLGNHWCQLTDVHQSTFGRTATSGKLYHCSQFSPFRDNGSPSESLHKQLSNFEIYFGCIIECSLLKHFSLLHFAGNILIK